MLGTSLCMLGHAEAGITHLEQARDIASELGEASELILVHMNLARNMLADLLLAEEYAGGRLRGR
jgi:hypothetical protein